MTAVITGATKGIGKATSEIFASKGFDLIICSRNQEELESFAQDLSQKYGVAVHSKATDVRDPLAVKGFGKFAIQQSGSITVLINNAGVFLPGDIHSEEEGQLELMMETNLYSAYHLSRAIIPSLIDQKKGHIFNICSVASLLALPGGGSYSISKFALRGFSTVLREEMKDKGVKVTSVLPGATWSNSWKGVELPYERLMEAEDIAKSIWACYDLGPSAVVEEILIRPQLGDL